MLTYSFVDIGSDSLYSHLYKCIKKDIINGVLPKGAKLPSKRSFAKHLAISVITVENTYAQLLAEGYIYSIAKRGYYVADLEKLPQIQQPREDIFSQVEAVEQGAVTDLLTNDTGQESFPFSIWAKLMREVLSEQREALMTPSPSGGVLVLRKAICHHLQQFRGMHVRPEQIIVGAGTEYLYGLLIQLLGRDRLVGLEDPGYQKIGQIYQRNQVSCAYIPLDAHGISLEEIQRQQVEIVHLSPSHHFPTGIVTPISRRYELLGWAASQEGRYIIEDDYDSEFRMQGKPIPSMQSMDIGEKVIYMNTFTKTLAPTIRISYMILPPHLLERFYETLWFYNCTVSNFEQYTLARFIHEGYFEKHINRMRSCYRERRDRMIRAIRDSRMGDRVEIMEEDAGLHFLLRVKTRESDRILTERIIRAGFRLSCLSEYYQQKGQDTHTLVVNYSSVREDQIEDAVARLSAGILG